MTATPTKPTSSARLRAPGGLGRLNVVLVHPEIPPNTGNVARLCAATRARLHLVHPLGFRVDEKAVRRAGLDYWHLVEVIEHASWDDFEREELGTKRNTAHFFTGKTSRSFLDVAFGEEDYLIFGRESSGLPQTILEDFEERTVGIPTLGGVRSLNLANAVALGVYEALRQTGRLADAILSNDPIESGPV